ncbi:uncharacterized protein TNCV_1895241 [Trichonephila clavipes]|nr:uncharacterized protein TNCV_1895241 [Trichonephila clavipes]
MTRLSQVRTLTTGYPVYLYVINVFKLIWLYRIWGASTGVVQSDENDTAAVAEWYRYRTVASFVTGSSPVPLKTRRVGQRCTLNLSRAETSSRWCGVVVRRGGASSGAIHVT